MSVFSLTTVQQAVWLDQQLMPDTPCYNIGALWHIDKSLDIALFHQAIRHVMRQHDALNIVLNENENGINQTTVYNKEPLLEYHDLSKESLSLTQAKDFLNNRFIRPFKLYGELLWRSFTVKVNDETTLWLLNAHHLIIDGTSISVLSKAVMECYKSLRSKELTAMTPLPGYREFIASDGDYLQSARYQRDREYWLRHFDRAPVSQLVRRPGFSEHKVWPSTHTVRRLPAARYQQLVAFSRHAGGSAMHFFSALIACWYARQWQTDEVALGVPVHNRSGARYKQMAGMFSSMIPAKLTIDTAQPFTLVIKQIADELRRNYRHQRFPIAELNRHLRLAQQGRRQLFDLSFSLEEFSTNIDLDGVPLKTEAPHHYHEQMPLAVYLRHYHPGDDPLLECNVNLAWFSEAEAEQIADRLVQMMNAILDGPENLPVAQLPLLLPDEQQKIFAEWNATDEPWPFPEGIHRWFEQRVAAQPKAVALCGYAEPTSYQSLNRQANQLARHLRRLGLKPDDRVALCVERGKEMVVALLAVLKAGGAYVPLDPDYPQHRLDAMLSDCGAAILLVDDAGEKALRGTEQSALLCLHLHNDRVRWREAPGENLPAACANPQRSLAYVIYTSGSTGKPKGVMNEHLAVMNRLKWMQQAYQLQPNETVLQKTPFSFDVSVWEFFWPLITGARLALAKPGGHREPDYLSELIREQQVTTLHFVPSMLQLFLHHGVMTHCNSLKRIICSGEALPLATVQRCHQLLPHAELHNLYGPTEAAVDVSWWHCQPGDPRPLVPIGRPIANTRLYILDAQLQPVPPGASGELHIGGIQVARGYLNRPDLNQERFIADPFSTGQEARLYKTGDLARWLDDGSIEYLGRNDFQVKIHGLRIEPGEIELQLSHCQGVKGALVQACDDGQGGKRLVAWVVAQQEADLSQRLRQALKGTLPDHMIPAVIVQLDAFPLSPNGKLDRKALPQPQASEEKSFVPPADDDERLLAECWRDLLGVGQISRDDDFFALGGHSLHAIQLMMRLKKQGIAIEMKTLFSHTTLQAQASAIRAGSPLAIAATPDPLQKLLKQLNQHQEDFCLLQPLNAHCAEQDLWMVHPAVVGCEIYRELALSLEGKMNVIGINNYNLFNQPHIAALPALASYYLQHIRQRGLPKNRPVYLLGWSLGGLIALEIAAQLEQAGYQHIHVFMLDSFYQTAIQQHIVPGMLASLLASLGLEGNVVRRALAAEETEIRLNNQTLSARLFHTRVTLFKATKFLGLTLESEADGREVLAIADNGLSKICSHLKVIPLAADHHSIISCHQEIIAALTAVPQVTPTA
ncbi:amino acid adenylation domain-containing protein [Erwinia phyllosphaerae]|uniref:amino acid adenylation domain-containing protein n=1 Tax=Erwinia phyllosphaerae TaxID=2853256 RepID=UPI001FEF672F|nr:amino acid adenylation domain-containing protein [Erwinia phyllosphaerae]